MTVSVEREKGVAVHIRHILFRFERNRALSGQRDQFRQRAEASVERKAAQFFFQVCDLRINGTPPTLDMLETNRR